MASDSLDESLSLVMRIPEMRTSSLAAVLLVLGPAHVANGALAGQEQADAGLVTSAQILEWLRHPDDLAVRYTAVSAVRTFIKRQQPSRPEVDALVDSLVTLSTTGDDREARAFAVMALLAWARNDESAGSTGRNIATLEGDFVLADRPSRPLCG